MQSSMQNLQLQFCKTPEYLYHMLPFYPKFLILLLKLQELVFVQKHGCIILYLYRFMMRIKD